MFSIFAVLYVILGSLFARVHITEMRLTLQLSLHILFACMLQESKCAIAKWGQKKSHNKKNMICSFAEIPHCLCMVKSKIWRTT